MPGPDLRTATRTEAFNFKLPIAEALALRAVCQTLGISRQEALNRAVVLWLARNPAKGSQR